MLVVWKESVNPSRYPMMNRCWVEECFSRSREEIREK